MMKKNLWVLFAAALTVSFALVAEAQTTTESDTVEMVQLEDGQTGGIVNERQGAPGARDWATTPQPAPHHGGPGYPQPYPPHHPPHHPPQPYPVPAPYPVPYPAPGYVPPAAVLTCYARGNLGYLYYGTAYDMFQASQIAMNICQSTGQWCQPAGCRY